MTTTIRYRRIWFFFGWLMIAAVVYLTLTSAPPEITPFETSDKIQHLFGYAVLMLWFAQLCQCSRWIPGIGLVVMGIGLEVLQGVGGVRMFEYADMAANAGGVLVGWGLVYTPLGRGVLWVDRQVGKLVRG